MENLRSFVCHTNTSSIWKDSIQIQSKVKVKKSNKSVGHWISSESYYKVCKIA